VFLLQSFAFHINAFVHDHILSDIFILDALHIADVEEPEEETLVIARRKKFLLHPMSPEEAILQMELLGHTFFIFLNMETSSVGVVYKRNDGTYGLLETEF
jgi:putative sigma-54 modulation protein